MTDEIVYEEPGTDVATVDHQTPTLFGTADPVAVIERATAIATPLAGLIRKQKLSVGIQGREHVKVEGWTLLGSMLGVFPITVWSKPIIRDGKEHGWEARVEARTRDGAVIGAAEAQCTRDENQWSFTPTGRGGKQLDARDDYALRSMAQTRATSKALRQPLGFVMQLAGFEATPAEEMPRNEPIEQPVDDSDPLAVRVHFGKNVDTPLRDLTQRQREWYAGDGWAETKTGHEVSARDMRLRRAARLSLAMNPVEDNGPFAEIPF